MKARRLNTETKEMRVEEVPIEYTSPSLLV